MKRCPFFIALVILIASILSGCMLGKTLEQRIQQFADDLNQDLAGRANIYLNFHPTMTTDYEIIKDPAYFDSSFPPREGAETPYVITILDKTDPAAVTADISSTAIGVNPSYSVQFTMALDGMDYKIAKIYADLGAGWYWVVQ